MSIIAVPTVYKKCMGIDFFKLHIHLLEYLKATAFRMFFVKLKVDMSNENACS